MFNLNKKSQTELVNAEIAAFIEANPVLMELTRGNMITYNKENDMYEANFRVPATSNNGDEVIGINTWISFQYAPYACMNLKEIVTMDEYRTLELNRTKVEKLEQLIAEIKLL